uniref:Uncharacterized protein n=1 Tax=Wuchereria bancrofti TaxID=6293 RepID=A0AAF5PXX2_WUCBA
MQLSNRLHFSLNKINGQSLDHFGYYISFPVMIRI